jgi:hypothetical protein
MISYVMLYNIIDIVFNIIFDTVFHATIQVLFVNGLFACCLFVATIAQDWAEDSSGHIEGNQ